MSTKFLSPGWRMPRNANQSKQASYSLNFDGSNSVNCGNISALNGATQATWSCWYKRTGGGATYFMGSWGSGANTKQFLPYQFGSNGDMAVYMGNNASGSGLHYTMFQGNAGISENIWYHMAFVFDASESSNADKLKFYLNGTPIANTVAGNALTSLNSVTTDFILGTPFTTGFLTGNLQQVCIFDYALSASQVTTLWGGGTSVLNPMALSSPPIAYYPLGTPAWNGQYLAENNAIGDYVFDFNPGYFNLGASTLTSDTYSLSLWFNSTSTSTQVITEKITVTTPRPYRIYLYGSTGNLELMGTQTSGTAYNDGKWHNVVIVQDPSLSTNKSKGYVDGVLVTSNNYSGGTSGSNNFYIGGRNGTQLPYNGELSNFQLFDAALSGPEIETLYNYGSPIRTLANIPQNSNLKAWYKLDASEVYNSSTTEWEINNATAEYSSSILLPNAQSQNTSEYIQVSNYAGTSGLTSASYSFWYYTVNTNSTLGGWISGGVLNWSGFPFGQGGVGGNQVFQLYTSDGTQQTMAPGPGSRYLLSNSARALNVWVNVVLTYDGSDPVGGKTGSIRAYVNGVQQAIDPNASPQAAPNDYRNEFPAQGTINTGSLIFGTSNTGNSRSVNAQFSNFAAWNKALSQSEITEIVNGGQPKDLSTHSASSNLVSWWKFDNKTTGLVDTIGGYNASIVGSNSDVSSGSVSTLNGESSGMSQANLVQSDLQTVAPYSKYALDFDGTDDYIDLGTDSSLDVFGGDFSVSLWFKHTMSSGSARAIIEIGATTYSANMAITLGLSSNTGVGFAVDNNWNYNAGSGYNDGNWHHMVATRTSTTYKIYVDNTEISFSSGSYAYLTENTIGKGKFGGNFNGSISNVSVWNTALTSAQVTGIYNEGLPSDLNSHSAYSNLVSWWQLGENSSFNGNDWIVADEIGSNNGESDGMGVDALTNGVGTTANGVSTGMSEGSLVGDAPYSKANAISSGMSVLSRVTGSGNTP